MPENATKADLDALERKIFKKVEELSDETKKSQKGVKEDVKLLKEDVENLKKTAKAEAEARPQGN